jgi:tetratricopeptide (TPR) repeat protein
MRRSLLSLIVCLPAGAGAAVAAEPPPPLPMAGRVFPVYPLYPAYGPVPLAYAGETFVAADRVGYALTVVPVNYWSVPARAWKSVPHPQAAEVAARFAGQVVLGRAVSEAAALYDAGFAAYWSGDYPAAREYLDAAIARDPRDARAWAYLALARWALGDEDAGQAAARRAAAAAIVYPEENAGYLAALERVQGPARQRLTTAAADITTRPEAEAVLNSGPR